MSGLSPQDLAEIAAHGLSREEVERQLALLAAPPPPMVLDRPATLGDGIRRIDPRDEERLLSHAGAAAAAGRFSKFVPASGAATRMFQGLLQPGSEEERTFYSELHRFPFFEELTSDFMISTCPAPRPGEEDSAVRWLLNRYAKGPKALIPFHCEGQEVRTAFDEHLAEAEATVQDTRGICRLHFTVSSQHRDAFRRQLTAARKRLTQGVKLEVSFSLQAPASDTVALADDGKPFRLKKGRLLFRPGGHGSLLRNLEASGADVVFLKNIDNVAPRRTLAATARWKRLLAGLYLELEAELTTQLQALEAHAATARGDALTFARERLGLDLPRNVSTLALRSALSRPIRVCGMVPNQGEPGGGPYWVRSAKGRSSLQIVESAQMNLADPGQKAVVARATHFNPVDLVCGLRDYRGRPWKLADFVDPSTAFVTEKIVEGRKLRALEHPGLWNGAMAGWLTVFVEAPAETFTPVKSVFDLLRPEHQP